MLLNDSRLPWAVFGLIVLVVVVVLGAELVGAKIPSGISILGILTGALFAGGVARRFRRHGDDDER